MIHIPANNSHSRSVFNRCRDATHIEEIIEPDAKRFSVLFLRDSFAIVDKIFVAGDSSLPDFGELRSVADLVEERIAIHSRIGAMVSVNGDLEHTEGRIGVQHAEWTC